MQVNYKRHKNKIFFEFIPILPGLKNKTGNL